MAKLDKISLVWGALFALLAQALLEGIFYTVQLRLNEAFAISFAMALVAGLLFYFLYRLGFFKDETKPPENPVSKRPEKNEERDFQVEMLRLQLKYDNASTNILLFKNI